MKFYRNKDVNMKYLKNKTVSIIGFGAQGRNQALCMRDSGVDVIVGLRKQGKSWAKAKREGFYVYDIKNAVEKGDIINLLIPDEVMGNVYNKYIRSLLTPKKTLCFAHGFNIVFEQIIPPKNIDVIMVAPNAAGIEMRQQYLENFGVPGIIAIHQNISRKAKPLALALAKSLGLTRIGVMQCTFKQETYSDLFSEETVIAGGVLELMKSGFETLVEKGIPQEMAYFCCLHEMKSIVSLIYNKGIEGMYNSISNTAEFGARTVGKKVIGNAVKLEMEKAFSRIKAGQLASSWLDDFNSGLPKMKALRKADAKHPIEKVGKKLRKMMWGKKS